jgi:hypothetical protein
MNSGAKSPVYKSDSRINLTSLESSLYKKRMARFQDILDGLHRQAESDAKDIHAMNDHMNALRPAYQKYRELSEQIKLKDERVRISAGLVANSEQGDAEDDFKRDMELTRICESAGIAIGEVLNLEIWKFPLWKIIREIVRQTPEMQVIEIETALRELGTKPTRQAIESALETHRKEFRIVKRGRDKFVSLKGA